MKELEVISKGCGGECWFKESNLDYMMIWSSKLMGLDNDLRK